MIETAHGRIIYEPCSRDDDTIYDVFEWLRKFQSTEPSAKDDQMLEIYLLNRIAWELEGSLDREI